MRIIFFAGKGGVGKTSVSAATGIKAAERGQRTVIMSLDVVAFEAVTARVENQHLNIIFEGGGHDR